MMDETDTWSRSHGLYGYYVTLKQNVDPDCGYLIKGSWWGTPENRIVFRFPPKATRPGGKYHCRIFPVGFFGAEGKPCEWDFDIRADYPETEFTPNCMQE